jgi:hypothetical protein
MNFTELTIFIETPQKNERNKKENRYSSGDLQCKAIIINCTDFHLLAAIHG